VVFCCIIGCECVTRYPVGCAGGMGGKIAPAEAGGILEITPGILKERLGDRLVVQLVLMQMMCVCIAGVVVF